MNQRQILFEQAKPDFQLVECAPYPPDLAPSDQELFPKLKERLRGKRFPSDNEILL